MPLFHMTNVKSIVASWRHQMETFSALLAICADFFTGPGEFPAHRPMTRSLDAFFDLSLNLWLSKQSRGWWFETQSRPLWRHCNEQLSIDFMAKHPNFLCDKATKFHYFDWTSLLLSLLIKYKRYNTCMNKTNCKIKIDKRLLYSFNIWQ